MKGSRPLSAFTDGKKVNPTGMNISVIISSGFITRGSFGYLADWTGYKFRDLCAGPGFSYSDYLLRCDFNDCDILDIFTISTSIV